MNTESAQDAQNDGISAEDIREELSALKDNYAELLRDHAELAAMVAELTSDKIDESDNEALKKARDNIEKIRNKDPQQTQ